MNPAELTFGAVIVVVLTGLAGYFGWKQLQTLRSLRLRGADSPEDHRYLRRQAWRRLACCGLMLVFAAMLVGWFWLEPDFRQVMQEVNSRWKQAAHPAVQPEHTAFVRSFTIYWILALFVLFAFVILAILDMWAIARFGLRHHRRLKADHQASLAHQVARLRSQRNGHG